MKDEGPELRNHSRLMESAYQRLSAALAETPMNTPAVPVVCNVDARAVSEPDEIRRTLADQVTGSVRWTESVEYLLDHEKVDLLVEIGPGGVLAGLVNRIRKGAPVLSISNVATLEEAITKLGA